MGLWLPSVIIRAVILPTDSVEHFTLKTDGEDIEHKNDFHTNLAAVRISETKSKTLTAGTSTIPQCRCTHLLTWSYTVILKRGE